jgi:hypothetical protein
VSVELEVNDEALGHLKDVFVGVEGSCEAWTDEEVVRRVLIRGAMEYAKSAGLEWDRVQAVAGQLRGSLG